MFIAETGIEDDRRAPWFRYVATEVEVARAAEVRWRVSVCTRSSIISAGTTIVTARMEMVQRARREQARSQSTTPKHLGAIILETQRIKFDPHARHSPETSNRVIVGLRTL